MHDIEPYHRWRDEYIASEDEQSPFYGRIYDEFAYTQKIYNYFIHPQWDFFGSNTLYVKILYIAYDEGFCILEFIGEWNDCLANDIMFLKREIIDQLALHDINKFILMGENVLNFHGSDDCYYEEWYDDIKEDGGWICLLNLHEHVMDEMKATQLQYFVNFGKRFNDLEWRGRKPEAVFKIVEKLIHSDVKKLTY